MWRHSASWGSARLEKRRLVKESREEVTDYLPSPPLSVNECIKLRERCQSRTKQLVGEKSRS